MRFFTPLLTAVLCLGLAAPAALANEITLNRVVAVVNGDPITLHELEIHSLPAFARARINPNDPANKDKVDEILKGTLDEAIVDKLIYQEAQRLGVTVSESEVDAEIQEIMKRNNLSDPVQFERAISAQGLDMDSFRARMRNNIINSRLTNQMVSRQIMVTNAEIEQYYNQHKDEYIDSEVDLQVLIFHPAMQAADIDRVVKGLKSGKLSFAEAVQKCSVGPAQEDGGKVLGASWLSMSPQVQTALKNTPPQEISGLIDSDGQKILVIPLRIGEARQLTLEEVRPGIESVLKGPRAEARFEEYVTQLRNKAVIDIRL